MGSWKFWTAFGVGVAAGAAVALLYAPQAGDRTRFRLKRGLDTAGERLHSTAADLTAKAEHYGRQAESAIRHGREAVDEVISRAGSLVDKADGFI